MPRKMRDHVAKGRAAQLEALEDLMHAEEDERAQEYDSIIDSMFDGMQVHRDAAYRAGRAAA